MKEREKITKNNEMYNMIPKAMLKKLYIQGSLAQEGEEYSFQIRNNLYPGTVKEVEYVKVDDQELDLNTITIFVKEQEIAVAKISEENPFKLTKGDTFTFKVKGSLSKGTHTLSFNFKTIEAGKMVFDVEDKLE